MSDKNMDDLLAQLKNEFEPQPRATPPTPKSPTSELNSPPSTPQVSIEDMLAELGKELEFGSRPNRDSKPLPNAARPKQENAAQNRQRLNALIDQDYQRQAAKREAKLAEIKRQSAARIAEQQRRQQELLELQQREAKREQRRKEALKEQAKQWLKNLNPRSEEGKWFEEFSYSYDDKIQAASDYLEAMRETGL